MGTHSHNIHYTILLLLQSGTKHKTVNISLGTMGSTLVYGDGVEDIKVNDFENDNSTIYLFIERNFSLTLSPEEAGEKLAVVCAPDLL